MFRLSQTASILTAKGSTLLLLLLLVGLTADPVHAGQPPIITTVAGSGSPDGINHASTYTFTGYGVTADDAGNIYYCEEVYNRVRRIDAVTGNVTTVVGTGQGGFAGDGGQGNQARIGRPTGVAFDNARNVLYMADHMNHRIRRVDMATGIITTVVGTGVGGFYGDGGQATVARINFPVGLAVDTAGNIYIGDRSNNRLRKVDIATGIITTIAGNGSGGFTGDGTSALTSQINQPHGVTVDGNGNVYFADRSNQRFRRVDGTTGIITTTTGAGAISVGFSGDGALATSAQFNTLTGGAIDAAGNLFVADANNHRVRRIDAVTGIITTFCGNGTASSGGDGGQANLATTNQPNYLTFSPDFATLYIAELAGHRVRAVNMTTNVITRIAGTGTAGYTAAHDGNLAINATLSNPTGLAATATDLYIADRTNHRIRRVNFASGNIFTLLGTGAATSGGDGAVPGTATLSTPTGLTINLANSRLYVAEEGGHVVREIDLIGSTITTVAGTANTSGFVDNVLATTGRMSGPRGLALNLAGTHLYVGDRNTNRVRQVILGGNISTIAGNNTTGGFNGDGVAATSVQLNDPLMVLTIQSGPDAGKLYIGEASNSRIRKVTVGGNMNVIAGTGNTTGGFNFENGFALSVQVNNPLDVTTDAANDIYISDQSNGRIRKITAATGMSTTLVSAGLSNPFGVFVPKTGALAGKVIVNDRDNRRIRRYSAAGVLEVTYLNGLNGGFLDGPGLQARLDDPQCVAVDSVNNVVYFSDRDNNRIRRIDASGNVSTVAGTGTASSVDNPVGTSATFNQPHGICYDPVNDDIYVCDRSGHRIRKVDMPSTAVTTVAGNGTATFLDHATNPLLASFNAPTGISVRQSVDANGPNLEIFVADQSNHRVRLVTLSATSNRVTTLAGNGTATFADNANPLLGSLNSPAGVLADGATNVYIADQSNHRIRRVTYDSMTGVSTTLTTVAGTGGAGFLDHGVATSGQFNNPFCLQFDDTSAILIADQSNHRIRRFVPGGALSTIAGDGNAQFAGDGNFAILASLWDPRGASMNTTTGEIFVADQSNQRIRKISTATPTLSFPATAVNGGASPVVNTPFSVVVEVRNAANQLTPVFVDTVVQLSRGAGTGILGGNLTGTILAGQSSVTITNVTYNVAENNVGVNATRVSGDLLNNAVAITFNSLAGSPARLGIVTQPVANATAGVDFATVGTPIVVRVEDGTGNPVPGAGYVITATINQGTSTLQGTLQATTIDVAGVGTATFEDLSYEKAETITISFTSGVLVPDTSTPIVVGPAAAAAFTVSGYPSPVSILSQNNFTVTALDAFGNVATGYTGTATFASSDPDAILPADYTFLAGDNGVKQLPATFKNPGTQDLTATDTVTATITGTQSNITLNNVSLVLNWTDPPFILVGTPLSNTQLNATANVPGTFSYNPPAGTLLPVGTAQTLQATFTPADIVNFPVTNISVQIDVFQQLASPSPPTATPNPANIGEAITFSWGVSVPGATITWDFKDGSPTRDGVSVSHAFAVPGNYFVRVKVTHPSTAQFSLEVLDIIVKDPNAPTGGGGGGGGGGTTGPTASDKDTDSDGYSDAIETALGSSPSDAGTTPFGMAKPATSGNLLTVVKLAIKLSFSKANADSVQMSGTFPIKPTFVLGDNTVIFDVGGIVKSFKLNSKGIGGTKTDAFKLSKPKNGIAKWSLKLKNGSFLTTLADEELLNQTAKGERRKVKAKAVFDADQYEREVEQFYDAKAGSGGKTK